MTELNCQKDFTRCGILLSQPIINDSRYDFLADINGKIYKIQCKSCHAIDEKESAIMFAVSNRNWNNGEYKNYHNQIDFFYTSFNEQGYLVPIDDVGTKSKVLRFFTDSSNAANPQISWAEDYVFEKQLEKLGYIQLPAQEERKKEFNYCKECGKEISKNATYCTKCVIKHRVANNPNMVVRPSREELKNMIRTISFVEIGRRFNVSDNAIRKWCDNYNLPRRSKDIKNYSDEEWSRI